MKVCDKCRKPMKKEVKCLGSDLCESCANHIKEWIRKPKEANIFSNILGGNQ